MQFDFRLALLVGGSLLISGCNIFPGTTAKLQAGLRIPAQPEPREYARQQHEAGRAALSSGNHATAIAAFRNSALDPDLAASSYNGLGIAYAGLGRNDLAERYFRMAMAADPASPRYAANLARLEQTNRTAREERMAREEGARVRQQSPQSRILPGAGARARLEVTAPANRIARTAGAPVHVGAAKAAPVRAVPSATLPVRVARTMAPTATGTVAVASPQSPALQHKPLNVALAPTLRGVRDVSTVSTHDRPGGEAPAIETTGRRYSPRQFAEIFEPYARSGQTPVLAAVSSPGLRSTATPQTRVAVEADDAKLALAGQ